MDKKRKPTIERINEVRRVNGVPLLSTQEIEDLRAIGIDYAKPSKTMLPRKFCAWDGEGITIEDDHKYILLMASIDKCIVDTNGLSTDETLWWITEVARLHPGYTHISYAFTYDVNKIIKELIHTEEVLERLHETSRVYWKQYSIEYRPHKSFTITRYPPDVKVIKNGKRRTPEASITIWDVFSFFGGSFLNALDTFFQEEELKELHYDAIKAGKDRRSDFNQEELDNFIIPYCKLELTALVRLMERMYNEYCLGAEIGLDRFDGPGAIAASVLKKRDVKQYFGTVDSGILTEGGNMLPSRIDGEIGLIPFYVQQASQHAYSGGRIELLQYGHFQYINAKKKIKHKDINSAYPSIMPDCCNYSNGLWVHAKNPDTIHPYSLYHIRWKYPQNTYQSFYPFFYRSDGGNISYPSVGEGWYHTPEVEAALKWNHILKGNIEVLEEWMFIPYDNVKPLSFVQEMYEMRKKLKAAGNGMNVVFKLGYNSFYGKFIQKLGYEEKEREGKYNWRPPYFQLQYGGYITSSTRAKLFDAAMQKPLSVIGFATDSIWSLEDFEVPESDNLGEWEPEDIESATFVQAGVYWTHSMKQKVQKVACPVHGEYCAHTYHYRGFDRENLSEDIVMEKWKEGVTELTVNCTRFCQLGGSLISDKRMKQDWGQWRTNPRTLQLHPTAISGKRVTLEDGNALPPYAGMVRTAPNDTHVRYDGKKVIISDKYPLPWTEERKEYNAQRTRTIEQYVLYDEIDAKYL